MLLAGNSGCNGTGQSRLLTVDKVLSVQPGIGMDNASELRMHLVQTDAVLVLFADTAASKNRSAGVLVASPYSFSLAYDSLSSSLVVFDGHAYEYSLPTYPLQMPSSPESNIFFVFTEAFFRMLALMISSH